MVILEQTQTWLTSLAQVMPVELFVMVGAFTEEIIAPIPSPIIMTLAGTMAGAKEVGWWYVLVLAFFGAIAKTLASVIVYFVSDKAEDVIVGKFGKFLGVTSKELEQIGSQFSGTNKDTVILAIARAVPIMPTAPVSIVCGIIKMDIKSYILGTGIGTFIRNILYLSLGYLGLSSLDNINSGLDSMESVVQLLLAAVGGVILLLLFYRRGKHKDLLGTIKGWFGVK